METSTTKLSFFRRPLIQSLSAITIMAAALGVFIYWQYATTQVSIDKSQITAPMIAVGPEAAGILAEVYVKAGDTVYPGEALARVGSETLSSKIQGLVVSINNTPGQVFNSGAAVVTMIDPTQLRVVGKIDEDKGLSRIKVGDKASFTVDAFGRTKFVGLVDEVSPIADQSSVVFNISDKREIKQFDVKVRFDTAQHPEFKNGMSAKIKVFTN